MYCRCLQMLWLLRLKQIWMAAGRIGTPSEGMIYLVAGKDWMARFNLACLLKNSKERKK